MNFRERVVEVVKNIPKGKVASYGQIASMAGSPRAARQVGFILRSSEPDCLPWWRVLNNAGVISIKGNFDATKSLQKQLLEGDGVVVSTNMLVDMRKYRHNFVSVL